MNVRKRVLSVLAVTLLTIFLLGCGSGDGLFHGPVTSAPRQFDSLQFTLSADKATLISGEQANFVFSVKNTGTQTITAMAPTAQTYQFDVYSGNQRVWAAPGGGLTVVTSVVWAPGETKTFIATWDLNYDINTNPVPAGSYTIRAFLPVFSVNNIQLTDIMDARAKLSAAPIQVIIKAP